MNKTIIWGITLQFIILFIISVILINPEPSAFRNIALGWLITLIYWAGREAEVTGR